MLGDKRKAEIFREVEASLEQGASREDLFKKYSPEFADREPLARKIGFYLHPKISEKYKSKRKVCVAVLIVLLILTFLHKLPGLIVLFLGMWGHKLIIFPFAALFHMISFLFILMILISFKKESYSFFLMMIFFLLMECFSDDLFWSEAFTYIGQLLHYSIIGVAILAAFLAHSLKQALYPHIRGNGLRKDEQGNFIFTAHPDEESIFGR